MSIKMEVEVQELGEAIEALSEALSRISVRIDALTEIICGAKTLDD